MLSILVKNIIDLKTDAIVNAANSNLWMGGGVCGAIFNAAGVEQLNNACREIGHCDTGSAVITDGFKLSKYIIHAVGPVYKDGKHDEEKLLYNCYKSALNLAKQYNCKSIAFPLISAGIYGYPKLDAWKTAIESVTDWLKENEDCLDVYFAVLSQNDKNIGDKFINEFYFEG